MVNDDQFSSTEFPTYDDSAPISNLPGDISELYVFGDLFSDTGNLSEILSEATGEGFPSLKNFLVYQVDKKFIAWLENIIARYYLVENTCFFDPSNFNWTTELESNWQIISKELDVILKSTNQLPSLHDISQCDYGLSHDNQ